MTLQHRPVNATTTIDIVMTMTERPLNANAKERHHSAQHPKMNNVGAQ